jgi:EAL domain-containing protein (putative c-di-GMP-specific phosphodiesterase class I)
MRCSKLKGTPSEIVEQLEYTHLIAKERRGVVSFDDSVRFRMVRRTHLIELIRRSIEQQRFQVWYQPLRCCHVESFCGAEALLRLYEEDGSPVPPDVFIPLAEETGLICDLTWIVLDDVCRLLSSGKTELTSVSVNLSMQQLLEPDLPSRIGEYLERYALKPESLKLEITERFVLNDAEYARKLLEELRAIGVSIVMDDFGTGYSNLSSVLQYPFSQVKLDRSLIDTIPDNAQADMMVEALLQLFHNMNMTVVAEGVEERVQAEYLKAQGVDMIQGYYYARPMPLEKLIKFLERE